MTILAIPKSEIRGIICSSSNMLLAFKSLISMKIKEPSCNPFNNVVSKTVFLTNKLENRSKSSFSKFVCSRKLISRCLKHFKAEIWYVRQFSLELRNLRFEPRT
ncbi:hypothetical protein Leryth_000021 [Lithospermum erythrorhizon]|nr:hypothetical protein Leryth_000021 [Lithospermum erythrorhizon]